MRSERVRAIWDTVYGAPAIEEAREMVPENELYLSVGKENLASLRAQLKNGAYIHHQDGEKYYTRIKL